MHDAHLAKSPCWKGGTVGIYILVGMLLVSYVDLLSRYVEVKTKDAYDWNTFAMTHKGHACTEAQC